MWQLHNHGCGPAALTGAGEWRRGKLRVTQPATFIQLQLRSAVFKGRRPSHKMYKICLLLVLFFKEVVRPKSVLLKRGTTDCILIVIPFFYR